MSKKKYNQNFTPCENTKLPELIPAIITNLSSSLSLTTCRRNPQILHVLKQDRPGSLQRKSFFFFFFFFEVLRVYWRQLRALIEFLPAAQSNNTPRVSIVLSSGKAVIRSRSHTGAGKKAGDSHNTPPHGPKNVRGHTFLKVTGQKCKMPDFQLER